MALKVALKFLKNFKILKKLSLKNAIFSISEAFLPVFMQFCAIGIIASPLPHERVSKFDTVLIGLFRSTSFFYYNVFRGFSQANIQV